MREIAGVIGGSTAAITNELTSATAEAREATDLQKLDREISPPNVVAIDSARREEPRDAQSHQRDSTAIKEEGAADIEAEGTEEAKTESPEWFVPVRTTRRRDASDAV